MPVPAKRRHNRHLHGEDRAPAEARADADRHFEQVRNTLNDRKTEAEPLGSPACLNFELMKLLENRAEFGCRYARASIPDFNAQAPGSPAAAKKDLALAGIFGRVGEQVAKDLLQEPRIAMYREVQGATRKLKPALAA